MRPESKIRMDVNSWLSLRRGKQLAVALRPRRFSSQISADLILQRNLADQVRFTLMSVLVTQLQHQITIRHT